MRKRITSLLLAFVLCLTLLPTAAFAADADDTTGAAAVQSAPQTAGSGASTPTGTALTQENISSYKQEKGGNYSENGVYLPTGSYYLEEDIYLVGDDTDPNSAWPLVISGSDVTLDLNGHVLDLKKRILASIRTAT